MCKTISTNTQQHWTKSSHHNIIRNKPQVMSFRKKNVKMLVQKEVKNRRMRIKQPKMCKTNSNNTH
jgi:hypothetical protein